MRNIRVDVGGGVEIAPVFRYSFPIFLASLVGIGSTYVDRFVVSYLLNFPCLAFTTSHFSLVLQWES